jgi:transposase
MAHARRGFDKAKDYDKEKAEYALDMFQKLYAIEQQAREENLSPAERYELRLEKALPVLNEIGKWMVETYKTSRHFFACRLTKSFLTSLQIPSLVNP